MDTFNFLLTVDSRGEYPKYTLQLDGMSANSSYVFFKLIRGFSEHDSRVKISTAGLCGGVIVHTFVVPKIPAYSSRVKPTLERLRKSLSVRTVSLPPPPPVVPQSPVLPPYLYDFSDFGNSDF